jgi:hypothetical protein
LLKNALDFGKRSGILIVGMMSEVRGNTT